MIEYSTDFIKSVLKWVNLTITSVSWRTIPRWLFAWRWMTHPGPDPQWKAGPTFALQLRGGAFWLPFCCPCCRTCSSWLPTASAATQGLCPVSLRSFTRNIRVGFRSSGLSCGEWAGLVGLVASVVFISLLAVVVADTCLLPPAFLLISFEYKLKAADVLLASFTSVRYF